MFGRRPKTFGCLVEKFRIHRAMLLLVFAHLIFVSEQVPKSIKRNQMFKSRQYMSSHWHNRQWKNRHRYCKPINRRDDHIKIQPEVRWWLCNLEFLRRFVQLPVGQLCPDWRTHRIVNLLTNMVAQAVNDLLSGSIQGEFKIIPPEGRPPLTV